jgi:serine/threonine protein kinase
MFRTTSEHCRSLSYIYVKTVHLDPIMMDRIQDYPIIETLYESSKSRVYREQRSSDNLPVILKVLQPDNPSPEAIARFRAEYEIACSL